MTFFPDDRASELRELFFETATELLQTLNEEGLQLEKRPQDEEILRQVRRTVHTLKGDSAACGYTELSELAHSLEDVLRPEVAAVSKQALAEVVLIAADTFSSMLSAYRGNLQPPAGEELQHQILALTRKPAGSNTRYKLQARFVWNEYEQVVVADAIAKGDRVYNIAFSIEPQCPMRGAAMQLIRNVLQDCGRVLAIVPDQSSLSTNLDVVEAAISSDHEQAWIEQKCRIPAVVGDLLVQAAGKALQPADDVLDIVKHVTASVKDDIDEPLAPEEHKPAVAAAHSGNGTPTSAANSSAASTASASTASASASSASASSASAASTNVSSANASSAQQAQAAESGTNFANLSENLLRVDADRIDSVLNLVGELIIAKSMLHQAINEFDRLHPKDPLKNRFSDAMAFQARIMNDLQKSVMKIRMVPVEHLFRRFPRVVRDVSKSCGKEVHLVVSGQDTDLDKSILDTLAEPLAHLVRNAVDHGIESPTERVNAGKPAHGTVRLDAYHQGNQIVIEVSDDGRGIDRDRILAKAIDAGLIKPGDAAVMPESDVNNLIFHPGLTTADQVTSISGRGVGMDVVKTVLEKLKGSVSIKSTPGKGTTFFLKVPLTLAIIKALLFRVGNRLYAVPLVAVVEITRTRRSELHRVDNHDVMQLRNEVLPLLHLHRGAQELDDEETAKMFVVVISTGERKFGLVVDTLVGEEELVIKAMDDHLVATDLVSGAAILGDGTVVLILNLSSVVTKLGRLQMVGATA